MSVKERRQELRARGVPTCNRKKPELQQELRDILEGIQRVLSLLLFDPPQNIQQTALARYEILASEPLHDLKGHLSKLLNEMPSLLRDKEREQCKHLIAAKIRQKVSAADVRTTMISLYAILQRADIDPDILDLIKSAVKMSEILYAG